MDEMENTSREAGGKIRAEVERAIFYDAAGEIDTGIFFGGGELDVGISFVVPKHDVELRVVLLDEIVFESEGFALIFNDDGFEVYNFAGERAGFGVGGPARFKEVRTDAIAEGARFADVNNFAAGVFEHVNSRAFGKLRGLFFGFHGESSCKF